MNETTTKSGSGAATVIGVVLLVIGLAVGFGVTKAMDNKKINNAQAPTGNTKAADLRANLVTLGIEHMTYTDQAVDAALDGSPNANQLASALYANGNDLGAAVGSVYGPSAQKTFDAVWKLHLDDFVKYAVADKQGDTSAANAALADIDTNYTKPLAQYLAKANPNLPENVLESSLRDHVNMTATMIDDHVKGNYSAESTELGMANQHMEGLFSTLADAIVTQYPSKF